MTSIIYTKSFDAPPVDRREILRYAGVRGEAFGIEELLDECLSLSLGVFKYKVCYLELDIVRAGENIRLGTLTSDSHTLLDRLSGCNSAIVLTASVGSDIDRLIKRYSAISPSRAVMLSAIGTERVESLCDVFCGALSIERAAAGEVICPRFSPGYGDLPLSAQRDIFDMLECPRKIGVSLGDNLLMTPTKSVSAIMGIRREK